MSLNLLKRDVKDWSRNVKLHQALCANIPCINPMGLTFLLMIACGRYLLMLCGIKAHTVALLRLAGSKDSHLWPLTCMHLHVDWNFQLLSREFGLQLYTCWQLFELVCVAVNVRACCCLASWNFMPWELPEWDQAVPSLNYEKCLVHTCMTFTLVVVWTLHWRYHNPLWYAWIEIARLAWRMFFGLLAACVWVMLQM